MICEWNYDAKRSNLIVSTATVDGIEEPNIMTLDQGFKLLKITSPRGLKIYLR